MRTSGPQPLDLLPLAGRRVGREPAADAADRRGSAGEPLVDDHFQSRPSGGGPVQGVPGDRQGQERVDRARVLLGACPSGLRAVGQELAGSGKLGVGLGGRDRHTVPSQR
jgi:hypothetical protein